MAEFLASPTAQIVILLAVTACLIAIGVFVIMKVRESMREEGSTANSLLTHFRDIHSRGGLSDDEFRTVKAKLGTQLKEEVKVSENKKE